MEQINLPATSTVMETDNRGSFSIEPLFPGYGSTLGNALRRVLLSSLEGAAVDWVEIEGVQHEFSTMPHIKEDVTQILLSLKSLRFSLVGDSAVLTMKVKKNGVVTAADFDSNSDCSVVNKTQHIATLSDGAQLNMQIGVVRGQGYLPVEKKENRNRTVGTITTDSIFSPIVSVSYKIENTRVGQMTNFDKLLIDITTDGSVAPSEALKTASAILTEQYKAISGMADMVEEAPVHIPKEEIIIDGDSLNILHTLDPKTRIEDTGLSGRTAHALIAAGYKTLSGLKRLSDIKLQSIKGLGAKGVEEVKVVLSRVD